LRAIDPQAVPVGEEGLRRGAGGLRAGPDGGGRRPAGLAMSSVSLMSGSPFRGWCCRSAIVGGVRARAIHFAQAACRSGKRKAHAS
jgi:hypothetical protein